MSHSSIKVIICDLDGSLMIPSGGVYVDDEIANKLIKLQELGIMVILNSARTFQGIEPLSKQIKMDQYGGYIISCNGANIKDAKTLETVFEYKIDPKECLQIWSLCQDENLIPGFVQPMHAVCKEMTDGYRLDQNNCQVHYIITNKPQEYLFDPIWKMCISGNIKNINERFDVLKTNIEHNYPLKVIRSTQDYIDVVSKNVSKYMSCHKLLNKLDISWQQVSYIGDGEADLECIKASQLGVSLENAKESIKAASDMIVPSCYQKGCLVWLDMLIKNRQKQIT